MGSMGIPLKRTSTILSNIRRSSFNFITKRIVKLSLSHKIKEESKKNLEIKHVTTMTRISHAQQLNKIGIVVVR